MIQSPSLPYREALLHLTSTKLQDVLVVLEAETVSANLDVIDQLSSSGAMFSLMDIQSRGLGGMSLAYLTSKADQADVIYGGLQKLSEKLYNFEVLRELPEHFADFFPSDRG